MSEPLVMMIDDDKIVRDSVCTFIDLKTDFSIRDKFSNAEDFLSHSFKEKPSILILDVGLPGMLGTEAIPHILQKYPELDIIMLTTYEEEDVILKALCAGACSYISKRAGLKAIGEAIEVVANGGSYISPRIAKEVTRHFFSKPKSPIMPLKGRQKQVMDLLIEGKTYADISHELSISVETVRSHIKKIYRLLHVNNKAEAIVTYINTRM